LARPVVEVKNFLTGELEYELYTFGEQTMVIPVRRKYRASKENKTNLSISENEISAISEKILRLIPNAITEISENSLIIRIPRHSKITAKKVKSIKKIADEYGLDLKFIPLD